MNSEIKLITGIKQLWKGFTSTFFVNIMYITMAIQDLGGRCDNPYTPPILSLLDNSNL